MSKHLITTKSDVRLCRKCGAPVLMSIVLGLVTRVDPWPADEVREVVALIMGRDTFSLTTSRQLVQRAGGPAFGPVLVEHRCGFPVTSAPAMSDSVDLDECPF